MAVPYDVPVFPVPNLISATRVTGTKAEFNAALSDGDFAFAGGGGGTYTDEMAQDAVGIMLDASLTYVDATPLLQRAALTGAITAAAGSNATALGAFTKAELSAAVSDGDAMFVGDAPTAHTHPLSALTQSAATTGQVAQWNGTAWVPATVAGGAGLGGSATLTMTGAFEDEEIITATGVTAASRVQVWLAAGTDADENTADMLDLVTIAGMPGTNQITVLASFSARTSGPILINWSAV